MAPDKVNFWNSLVSRFALFFAGLNVLAILIVGYLVYNQAATVITSHSQDRMRYSSNLAIKSFNSLLNEVANDIAVTTNTPVLGGFTNDPDETNLSDLKALFSVILKNKPNYFQIRLLDVNNQGKEVIRYDKVNGEIVQVPDDQLQFKGNRLYYQEALKIPPTDYYYSDINLNEEFGKVSQPHIPTLRAVGKVYSTSQTLEALLVINVDLSAFYQELNQIMETDYQLMIVNDVGDYLFAPDMARCFGKQLNSGISFNEDFGMPVDSLINGEDFGFITDTSRRSYLYHVETLVYSSGQRIYLVNMLEDNLLFRSAYLVRNDSFKLVLLVCFLSLIIGLVFTRVFSKDITQITRAVSSFNEDSRKSQETKLPVNRQDELGVLARTFKRMQKHLDRQFTELKTALGREKQAIRERDQFLQNMSHELRTPLTAILGLTQLLNKNQPSKAQQPIIESLERSASNLSGLMHDLLDHQKLIEGKIKLSMVDVNFNSLLSDIHAGYRYDAINKGLDFKLQVADSLKNDRYLMDPLRFNQLIINLVVNAIKFTDQGFVQLKAKITEADPSTLEVQVADSGRGIQPENLQKIKERFYQEGKGQSVDQNGYGLGLSIVKQLVDLFAGRLEVVSDLDKGSKFTINLPLTPAGSTAFIKATPVKSGDLLPDLIGNYSILQIEDDPSILMMVSHMLELPNIHIKQITTGDQENILETNQADLILSDLMLNNQPMDAVLLNFRKTSNTPLVILSAFEPDRMKAITPYYLQKPFELDDLRDLMVVLLGMKSYDLPYLEALYEQYDHQPEKIKNFLNILQNEFSDYINRFESVSITQDETEWKAIMHKLSTHIKSMRLEKLSRLIPLEAALLDQERATTIRNSLCYCLCVFRHEFSTLATT